MGGRPQKILLTREELLKAYVSASSVKELCEALDVHPATFHKWRKRYGIRPLRSSGDKHWNSKLEVGDAVLIMELKGQIPGTEVAEKFGVSPVTVYDIWEYRTRYKETL